MVRGVRLVVVCLCACFVPVCVLVMVGAGLCVVLCVRMVSCCGPPEVVGGGRVAAGVRLGAVGGRRGPSGSRLGPSGSVWVPSGSVWVRSGSVWVRLGAVWVRRAAVSVRRGPRWVPTGCCGGGWCAPALIGRGALALSTGWAVLISASADSVIQP